MTVTVFDGYRCGRVLSDSAVKLSVVAGLLAAGCSPAGDANYCGDRLKPDWQITDQKLVMPSGEEIPLSTRAPAGWPGKAGGQIGWYLQGFREQDPLIFISISTLIPSPEPEAPAEMFHDAAYDEYGTACVANGDIELAVQPIAVTGTYDPYTAERSSDFARHYRIVGTLGPRRALYEGCLQSPFEGAKLQLEVNVVPECVR